jgi:hypothetical protein
MIAQLFASGDCELIRGGLVDQPVNTASSVAYLIAGSALVERARHLERAQRPLAVTFGLATAANGLGSAAFHGVGGRSSRWLHDAAVLAVLGLVAVTNAERFAARAGAPRADVTRAPIAVVVGAAAVLALSSRMSTPSQALLMLGAVVSEVAIAVAARRRDTHDAARARRTRRLLIGGAVAAVLNTTARTGGPLCAPDSLLQGHAGWHVITALLLWWWAGPGVVARHRPDHEVSSIR